MAQILLLNGSSLDERVSRERIGATNAEYQVLDWKKPVFLQGKAYSCALIILDFADYAVGPMASQKRFLQNSTGVNQWIVVFMGVSGAFGAAMDKWKGLGYGIKAGLTVLYEHPRLPDLWERVREHIQKDPYRCLIGYYSKKECAENAANLFSQSMDNWEFEAVASENLTESLKGAGKLILLGQDEQEFQIPPVPVDIRKDLLLFLDCKGPVFQEYYRYRMDDAVSTLCSCGWKLSSMPPKCVIGNLQYETWKLYRSRLKEGEQDFHKMAIWDEYGIPYLHKDYTSEKIDSFLSGFDSVGEIRNWLEFAK